MYKLILLLFIGAVIASGCENNTVLTVSGENESTDSQEIQEIQETQGTHESKMIQDTQTTIELFELSVDEKNAYSNFQKDFDLSHLKGLEPISIAKLYVQAGINKKYDAQYAFYTDREEFVLWSKEEDEEIPETHRPTNEQILKSFKNIDKGKFIQTSEYEGYIEYETANEVANGKSGFHLVMNEDGIWQVSFMPIQ